MEGESLVKGESLVERGSPVHGEGVNERVGERGIGRKVEDNEVSRCVRRMTEVKMSPFRQATK